MSMEVICCKCKSDKACSSKLCVCRKNNLKCIAACGHCHGLDCANADILVADHNDSDSESECEDGNRTSLPDMMWDDDLEWIDEEVVVDLESDFIFVPNICFNTADIAIDEEIVAFE